jgi:uncharacterized protein (UPF0335 family)
MKIYAIQKSFEITEAEKQQAEKAIIAFNRAKKMLQIAINHLDIMYIPFKDNSDISKEQIIKFRYALRNFRDRVIENFNQFKLAAFKCVALMQVFSSDTQTFKLIKSFISSIDDLEDNVNDFADLFNDIKSQDFTKNIITSINEIKKDSKEIEDIIDDRIINHVQSNILGRTWVDSVSTETKIKIEKEDPLLLNLFKQRQKLLSNKSGDNTP